MVSQSISLECDADCTNYTAPPILIKGGYLDFVVARYLVVRDDPLVSETWLVNAMIPRCYRGDFWFEHRPLGMSET